MSFRAWVIGPSLIAMGMSCSTSPCDSLQARADACELPPSPYVSPESSTCNAVQRDLGDDAFAQFADCMASTSCEDKAGEAACLAKSRTDDACLTFRLWASGCGLEPVGTTDGCATLANSAGGMAFSRWVACMTEGGCPSSVDARFEACQSELVPGAATLVLEACGLITRWSAECDGGATPATQGGTTLPSCIAQAELFTAASYLAYAECLAATACDDVVTQVQCMLLLHFLDTRPAQASCERLVDYAETCESPIAGGSVDACVRIFARFTAESVESFASCVEATACDDAEGTAVCMGNLVPLE